MSISVGFFRQYQASDGAPVEVAKLVIDLLEGLLHGVGITYIALPCLALDVVVGSQFGGNVFGVFGRSLRWASQVRGRFV